MANKACKFSYTCEFSRQECRDLPPLVDELAEALKKVWANRLSPDGPGETIYLTPEECQALENALARYQEEVGDA